MESANPTPQSDVPTRRFPFLTIAAVLWSIFVFAALATESQKKDLTTDTLAKWGAAPGQEVWQGNFWTLFTSVFVHAAWWHLAFNGYWLLTFGTLLERRLGHIKYLLFFSASAVVSSSFELAVAGETGIGASGVVYAMFGLLLPLRKRWSEVAEFLTSYIVVLGIAWLIACIVVTQLDLISFGNAAHVAGMTFGLAVSGLFLSWPKRIAKTAIAGHLALAALFLFWCPWSINWLTIQAYNAHSTRRYAEAIDLYSRIISKDPVNSWAYHNRASAYQSLGRDRDAAFDLETAQKLDSRSSPVN